MRLARRRWSYPVVRPRLFRWMQPRLMEQIEMPVDGLVEAVEGRKIVHGDLTVAEEVLVLLMSSYPEPVPRADVAKSIDRRSAGSVGNAVRALWKDKLLHQTDGNEIVLTNRGMKSATKVAHEHLDR